MKKRHGPKHHGRAKLNSGPHAGVPKANVHRTDAHHNTKHPKGGGGMGRDKANTTTQTGNRPIRTAAKTARRASTQKHGKFSHNTVI